MYDDIRITYPQLVTAAQKAKSEQEDHAGEVICVRSIQAERKDCEDEQTDCTAAKWQYRSHRIPQSVTFVSWAVKKMVMEKKVKLRVKEKIESMVREVTTRE